MHAHTLQPEIAATVRHLGDRIERLALLRAALQAEFGLAPAPVDYPATPRDPDPDATAAAVVSPARPAAPVTDGTDATNGTRARRAQAARRAKCPSPKAEPARPRAKKIGFEDYKAAIRQHAGAASFAPKALMHWAGATLRSAYCACDRLAADGFLTRERRGIYSVSASGRATVASPAETLAGIRKQIEQETPRHD